MTRIEAQPWFALFATPQTAPSLTSRTCRCGRQLDSFGHHRAVCSLAGVLGGRSSHWSRPRQVCREAGARVRTNTFVRDLDLAGVNVLDGRRLEVVADGLTLWHGAQLAKDTTLVSPLQRDGTARHKPDAPRRPHARNSQEKEEGHVWWCSLPKLGGDGPKRRTSRIYKDLSTENGIYFCSS